MNLAQWLRQVKAASAPRALGGAATTSTSTRAFLFLSCAPALSFLDASPGTSTCTVTMRNTGPSGLGLATQIESLTATFNALSLATPVERRTDTFDNLPEELIDRIITFLGPQSSLAAAALLSRKLNRIVTPHLYTSVSVTVCKVGRQLPFKLKGSEVGSESDVVEVFFDLPTSSGCSAVAFRKTIRCRPDLARYTKYLRLTRDDRGFLFRKITGFYDFRHRSSERTSWRDTERAAKKATPKLLSELDAPRPRPATYTMDPGFEIVALLLRSLPHVNYLDFFNYHTDVPWDAFLSLTRSLVTLPAVQHDSSQLRTLDMGCCHKDFVRFWPLFTLPNVALLRLGSAALTSLSLPDDELQEWVASVQQSSIMRLELENLHIFAAPLRDYDLTPLKVALLTCNQLRHLVITSRPAGMTLSLLGPVQQYCELLESLAIHEAGPPLQVDLGVKLARLQLLNAPGSPVKLRQSHTLRELTMDLAMLLSLTPASQEVDHVGRASAPFDAPQVSDEKLVAHIDFTLPRTLTSLKLRVGNEQNLQLALLTALDALRQDVRSRLPNLKQLEVAWQKGGMLTKEQGATLISPDLIHRFRRQGVELFESLTE